MSMTFMFIKFIGLIHLGAFVSILPKIHIPISYLILFYIISETDTMKCYLRLIQSVSTSQTQPPGKGCVILKQSSSVRGVIPSNTAWEIVTILPTPAASM